MIMNIDLIDLLVSQWRQIRPDLDAGPMRISGRLLRLAKIVERRTEAALRPFRLSLWQFDVLATLRRNNRDLSPGEMLEATMLTSGAMTHRLDRLESAGWIERKSDPDDRRGVKVHLTRSGRNLVDKAIEARLKEASVVAAALKPSESDALSRLLEKLERALLSAEHGRE
jgi:DNA-binding MarR family transcriptional regulator